MTNKPYVIFSSLTESKGHLLLDDFFWFSNLIKIDESTKLYSSTSSIENVLKSYPSYASNLHRFKDSQFLNKINARLFLLFRILMWKPVRNSNIIVQGFDEIAIMLFFLKIRGRNNNIALVLTNNISPERFKNSKWLLRFLLIRIFRGSNVVFYHTNYELSLIYKFVVKKGDPSVSLAKLKYHLLGKITSKMISKQANEIISFYGPTMLSKPLDSIVELILADNANRFQYNFYNLNEDSISLIKEKAKNTANLNFFNQYMTYEEYFASIQASKYVLLPHNYLFEGKLSGILSDCIANGIPIISDSIEPVIEFFNDYGPMGFIFDYKGDLTWTEKFLEFSDDRKYDDFKKSMKDCCNSHREDRIIQEFVNDLG